MNTRGYVRSASGTLEIVDLHETDGTLYAGMSPLTRTNQTATLSGWADEGRARVYVTDGDVEVLVPEAH